MQVIPLVPWQHQADIEERSRRALAALIPEQSKDWCSPEYVVRWEYPPEAILHEAEKREVDLIVLSVHHSRSASSSHLPWPVASGGDQSGPVSGADDTNLIMSATMLLPDV